MKKLNNTKSISKMFLFICVLFGNLWVANAADTQWELLGKAGFIKAWARPAMVVDSNNTPFVSYIDRSSINHRCYGHIYL